MWRPSYCDLTVKCRTVTPVNANVPCQELDASGETTWTIDGEDYNNGLKPGTYIYTYNVQVADVVEPFTVTIVLSDPFSAHRCRSVSVRMAL